MGFGKDRFIQKKQKILPTMETAKEGIPMRSLNFLSKCPP
jgi:hypothetical protein